MRLGMRLRLDALLYEMPGFESAAKDSDLIRPQGANNLHVAQVPSNSISKSAARTVSWGYDGVTALENDRGTRGNSL